MAWVFAMLTLTRKTDYALVALAHLAQRDAKSEGLVSARQIAEAHCLPLPLLMNILKELAAAKLVQSTRGAAGGYALAQSAEAISLMEVVQAIEGPLKLTSCCDPLPIVGQTCVARPSCPIQNAIQRLHRRVAAFFGDLTLADLLEDPCCCQRTPVGVSFSPATAPAPRGDET